jgi:hypothetical protein
MPYTDSIPGLTCATQIAGYLAVVTSFEADDIGSAAGAYRTGSRRVPRCPPANTTTAPASRSSLIASRLAMISAAATQSNPRYRIHDRLSSNRYPTTRVGASTGAMG